jgi:hypothetical protein
VSSVVRMLFEAAHAVKNNLRTVHFEAFTKSVHVRKVMSALSALLELQDD